MYSNIIVIILMVICSAYFSASETSFSASNKMRLKKAAEAGSKTAKLAYKISEDYTSALSAILIGNNLANIAASTAATVVTVNLLLSLSLDSDGLASVISTVGMTLIILIFGEIVPKILAKNNADKMVRFFAYPTRILMIILFPLVWLVMRLVKLLAKIWGKDDEEAPTVTEEELSSIIETVEEEGIIDEEQSELLQSTLDFRDTTVEEIMTPRIDMTTFDISDDEADIKRLIGESRHSRIPVYEDSIDEIIGVLYLNHYYKAMTVKNATKPELRDLLMKPLMIHKTMKLPAALSMLREKKVHLAIVVDEYGGTLGVVTIEDILEELVGDIWDESDEIITECVQTGENTFEVSGDMNIDDFFEEIEFEPEEFSCEYSTMGGWAIEMLDSDPHVGDTFTFSDKNPENDEDADEDLGETERTELCVVVLAMEDMRVTKLTVLVNKISLVDDDKEEDEEKE